MKKQLTSITLLLVFFSLQSYAQNKVVKSIGCGVAVGQLINYGTQVNNFYNTEFHNIIPNQRCPAVVPNQWGHPVYVNPMAVQGCRQQHLVWLNQWYAQQVNYVNGWQSQIANSCFTTPPDVNENTSKIETEELEELEVGLDETKSLKITIPTTAEGYSPRKP